MSLSESAPWPIRSGRTIRLAVRRHIAPRLVRWRGVAHDVRRRISIDLATVRSALRSGRVGRRLLALNLCMAAVSVVCSIRIGHAVFTPAHQSPLPSARPLEASAPREHDVARAGPPRGDYELIAKRTLFHPDRSDSASSATTARTSLPVSTLALYGVAISDDTRVAFVHDLVTKRISSYRTGDELAGGQVERIEPDRVVITRADGPIEVLLHRPKEPSSLLQPTEEPLPRRARGRQD